MHGLEAVKFLVIDDHPLVREGISAVLRQLGAGIQVVEAADGARGLEQATAVGETVRIRFMNEGVMMHPWHSHGYVMKVIPRYPQVEAVERQRAAVGYRTTDVEIVTRRRGI